ncbi:MAG: ThuA domain-containing protein [Bacteroidales bacterium]|nr:ThuA domain-containing protein [Bacteroidales bacterium]
MKTIFRSIFILIIAIGLLAIPACQNDSEINAPYKALIVTGQNNHSWEASTPILKEILENTQLFACDIAKSPAQGEDMSDYSPIFTDYDVIVLDYTGDAWPEKTQTAFLEYVDAGGGVVVYHAANNAFPDWKEFNKVIGLGGWGDRNEKNGPYVRWKNGEITRDLSSGRAGSHGEQHAFVVTIREKDHPITKGMPETWLHAQDELYSELRGPAENMTVLATAFADTAKGGTGENEPALMTIKYGEGRVFHTTLGHVTGTGRHPAVECVGFIVTLQRGAEWAATGDVLQEIPIAFPGHNSLSSWDKFRPYTLDELLECMEEYMPGDSRVCLQDLSNMIRKASTDTDKLKAIELSLIDFLKDDATDNAKNYVLKELSLIGTKASIPVLEKLMKDDDTKEMARFATERITNNYTN